MRQGLESGRVADKLSGYFDEANSESFSLWFRQVRRVHRGYNRLTRIRSARSRYRSGESSTGKRGAAAGGRTAARGDDCGRKRATSSDTGSPGGGRDGHFIFYSAVAEFAGWKLLNGISFESDAADCGGRAGGRKEGPYFRVQFNDDARSDGQDSHPNARAGNRQCVRKRFWRML